MMSAIHPAIIWFARCEAKIYLVRTGDETVEKAIMDLAPAFYELVRPARERDVPQKPKCPRRAA
jgi:hypothetical protein